MPDLGSALYEGDRLFVFKLHGDIARSDTVVLTSQDHDRLILRNPALRSFLQAIFLNFNLLFVGYSVSDPDFQLVLKELNLVFEGRTPTHYALLPDADEFTIDHLMGRMNIQVIPYDSKGGTDHTEVSQFLKTLQQVKPYTTPIPSGAYDRERQESTRIQGGATRLAATRPSLTKTRHFPGTQGTQFTHICQDRWSCSQKGCTRFRASGRRDA